MRFYLFLGEFNALQDFPWVEGWINGEWIGESRDWWQAGLKDCEQILLLSPNEFSCDESPG